MVVSRRVVLAIVVVIALAALVPFVVDTGSSSPGPVSFHDTVTTGVVLQDDPDEQPVEVPRAQVFYSQYEYAVGYNGVERFVDAHDEPDHQDRFGYPLAVYVTDYGDVDPKLGPDGHLEIEGNPGWTGAESAAFVVDSDARSPAGETVVPFADREDADAFAATHGGTVVGWEALLEREFGIDDAAVVRDRVDDRHERADAQVANATTAAADRPVEVVVGEDAPTVEAAVESAPAESTVLVPDGTHDVPERLEIDRPITLAGTGNATLDGDGNGSVVGLEADGAAIRDLQVTGVGDSLESDDEVEGADSLEMAYGQGDAGVAVESAEDALVENVTIETPANGVLLRDAPGAVVRDVTVYGNDDWSDGYMGVMTMRSPDAVVEDSRFVDGRDGVYAHRSDGLVFRDNDLENPRIGVHLMYTSGTLIADNRIDDPASTGIDVMTDPEHTAVVGNEVRGASQGILTAGTRSYVADNLVVGADVGMTTAAGHSIYEGNALVDNVVGVQANQLLPTNQVTDNDFVGNADHATARLGPLRTWADDGAGNFWEGAIGPTDGAVLERPYSPTDPVDERLHRVDGTPTIAQSPATTALSSLEGSVSGMRSESVVDPAPRCEPANPDLLERAGVTVPDRDCEDEAPGSP